MATINDLRELLKHELEDLYSAETQLVDALPTMAKAANNSALKKAFTDHLAVTKEHKKRLDKVQQLLGNEKASPENKGFFAKLFSSEEGETHCKAMEGLVKEANSLMDEDMTPEVKDAALIAAAQKVEHYEISSYGTARAYAVQLGETEVEKLLTATLNEEYNADDSLTKLAVQGVNEKAEGSMAKTTNRETDLPSMSEDDTDKKESIKTAPVKSAAKKTTPAKKTASKKAPVKKSAASKAAPKKAVKKTTTKKR